MPWFSHCFATIDNFCTFCLVFVQWLNKTKNQKQKKKNNKNNKNKKPKKQKKWQDPTLCHYSPPWGVQSCFFGGGSWFFGFLFSSSLFFFPAMANKTKNQKNKKREQHETKKKRTIPKNKIVDIYIYISHYLWFILIFTKWASRGKQFIYASGNWQSNQTLSPERLCFEL